MWRLWLIGLVLLGGCDEESGTTERGRTATVVAAAEYTIRVTGDEKFSPFPNPNIMLDRPVTFKGSIAVTAADGTRRSESHDGKVPIDYKVRGLSVSVSLQKSTDTDQQLKVEILRDGKVIQSGETTASYGVVSLTAR